MCVPSKDSKIQKLTSRAAKSALFWLVLSLPQEATSSLCRKWSLGWFAVASFLIVC